MRLAELAPLTSATAFVCSALQAVIQWRNVRCDRFVAVPAGRLLIWQSPDCLKAQLWIIHELQERSGRENSTSLLDFERLLPYCITCMGVVTMKPHEPATPLSLAAVQRALDETRSYWEAWSQRCTYQGEYRDSVLRSALTLKLLTFEPTGAIVAAPTTSLPEAIGGARNWDYRFTWLRDATFTLTALMHLGYVGEAHDFLQFLQRACACPEEEFQILYGIRGERDTREEILTHLDGYRGSKPVRVGNAAAGQIQLDVYGELLDCLYLYLSHSSVDRTQEVLLADVWLTVESVAEYGVRHWRDPDRGIWEVRGGDRHFAAVRLTAARRGEKPAEHALLEKQGELEKGRSHHGTASYRTRATGA